MTRIVSTHPDYSPRHTTTYQSLSALPEGVSVTEAQWLLLTRVANAASTLTEQLRALVDIQRTTWQCDPDDAEIVRGILFVMHGGEATQHNTTQWTEPGP